MDTPHKPEPADVDLSRPYWEAARRGQLVLQRCSACGKFRHYPRLLCDACYSAAHEFVPAIALGQVHSWTVTHHVFHAGFAAEVPYALVTVDLQEGVRALGRWDGGEPLRIGLPVRAYFRLGPGAPELRFAPG
jgi:uncharacterized OB-fold protein